MSPLIRRRVTGVGRSALESPAPEGVAPRRPHAGLLRRERRALQAARETLLRDLGGLALELYRRGGFRDDLLAERCADLVGLDARLAEIETLLHRRGQVPHCACGTALLRGAHFCPNCGRPVQPTEADGAAGAP